MTTLEQKLQPKAGQSPNLTDPLIRTDDTRVADEANITKTSDNTRFHTVCKRVFRADPAYFPQAEYRGKTIYFCTESCLDAFLADPERFYCAHSQPASRK